MVFHIKGNDDDTRRDLAAEKLRRYKKEMEGEGADPLFQGAAIRRGLIAQGYEPGDPPRIRITPISF